MTKCDKGGKGEIFAQSNVTSFMDGPLSSNSNPAVGRNEYILTSNSELSKWLKMSDWNAQWCTKACKLF